MKKCFLVCPIGDEKSDTRTNSDNLLKHIIQPVCEENGFEVIRVDKEHGIDRIDNTILEHLNTADLVIVDMTEHNPNVFYEFGYRHATGKPLIPVKKKDTGAIPFDVANLRTTFYSMDVNDVEEAKEKLNQTISNLDFDESTVSEATEPNPNINMSLLNMSDKLDLILKEVAKRNDDELEKNTAILAKHLQPAKSKTQEEMLMEQFLQNPEKMLALAETVKKVNPAAFGLN
ncbi:hypothetical protein HCA00_04805 [Listeria booriae]|uniref:hypothetical protein n=1 Tax=Listeria booriae TaxID=1552123 RepID=UPI00164D199E|nr:hypothetical protein [Listeria booriae]MBC6128103.1 hypothetical protein [Listeria booriae]